MKIYLRVIYIMSTDTDTEAQKPGVFENLFDSATKGLTTTVQTVVGTKSLEDLQTEANDAKSALIAAPNDATLQAAVAAAEKALADKVAAEKGGGRRRRRSQKQRGGSKRRRSNSGGSRRRRNRKGKKSRRH